MKKTEDKKAAPKGPAVADAETTQPIAETVKNLPAVVNFEEDAGKGLEGADKDSYAIPFLMILQPGSPGVVDNSLPNAKAGMFINSVTKELFASPLLVPCGFQRRWVRWGARNAGGGYKGEFTTAQVNEMRTKGQLKEMEGRFYFPAADGSVNPDRDDRVSDTRNHFVLVMRNPEDDAPVAMVFALASTGIKVSKNFVSRIDAVRLVKADGSKYNPSSFSHAYSLKTEMKKNEKGTWWLPQIDMHGQVKLPGVYAAAKAFYAQVSSGAVTLATETARDAEHDGGGSAGDDDRM